MNFSNDPSKAQSNLKKHGVSFDEAETVFFDAFAVTFFDKLHSDHEDRYFTLGVSEKGKYIAVWHTEKDNEVRLIGAREMDRTERKHYENKR